MGSKYGAAQLTRGVALRFRSSVRSLETPWSVPPELCRGLEHGLQLRLIDLLDEPLSGDRWFRKPDLHLLRVMTRVSFFGLPYGCPRTYGRTVSSLELWLYLLGLLITSEVMARPLRRHRCQRLSSQPDQRQVRRLRATEQSRGFLS